MKGAREQQKTQHPAQQGLGKLDLSHDALHLRRHAERWRQKVEAKHAE